MHTYTHTYTHIHTHTHTYTHIHTHTHTHTYIHTYTCMHTYTYTHTYDQPYNLRQVLNMKPNYRQLLSSNLITFSLLPMPLNSVGNKSFRHLAPTKWNHLPTILLSPTVTINMLKRNLKSFLLR